ncbi:MAG: hypothetical protein EA343_14270 [Nodularia sp. (in: Bacteria)]|nr:MAG: hypothetical protein EA343_14270 [Nodularia sp. (in: cyanobacteria)]
MRTLTRSEYKIKAQPKLRQIFAYDDAFTQPFALDIPEKLIIAKKEGHKIFDIVPTKELSY